MHGIGGVPLASLGGGALKTYADKVLGYLPAAYWPLWETSGITARCLVSSSQNGTYNTDVSLWPPGTGIGDGNTAPFFDGTNDYVSLFAAAIQAAANTATTEGSVSVWYRVANVGVWTDGTYRSVYSAIDDPSNRYIWYKSGVNNNIYVLHDAGGTAENHTQAGQTATTWQHGCWTWSESADEVKYYLNGTLLATDTVIGNWTGDGNWTSIIIGANSFVPANVFHGWIAHAALFSRAIPQPTVSALATV